MLLTTTGTRNSSCRISRTGTSRQARLGASTHTPVSWSTSPGTVAPAASTRARGILAACKASLTID